MTGAVYEMPKLDAVQCEHAAWLFRKLHYNTQQIARKLSVASPIVVTEAAVWNSMPLIKLRAQNERVA